MFDNCIKNINVGDYQLVSTLKCIIDSNSTITWDVHDNTPDVLHVTFKFEKDESNPKAYTKVSGPKPDELEIIAYNVPSSGLSMVSKMQIGSYDNKKLFMTYLLDAQQALNVMILTINLFTREESDGKGE